MNQVKVSLKKKAQKDAKEKIVKKNKTRAVGRIDDLKKIEDQRKKKANMKKFIRRIFLLLILAGIAYLLYFGYMRWDKLQKFNEAVKGESPEAEVCTNILDPKCWGEALTPKLKQENGITGALIVGLDTRDEGGVADGLQNTDSIMAAFYDHESKKTTLISLPRDLYIPYDINDKGPYYAKINAIYATGESRDDVEDGFDLLEETVEKIVGKEIQYRVIIKLKGVEDGVNAVGGVEVDVPTYLKVQYPNDYPGKDGKPNTTWLYYEFEPGVQKMDGEHALVWSRFRTVVKGDMNYASDFSRADRQQQVLDALKEKILDEEGSTLDKAEKYWGIFNTISKNVEANIGLEEIFAGLSLASDADRDPINIVFDPNFGGLNQIIYHPPTTETGGYQIRFKDQTFKAAQDYLALIEEYPGLYDENAKIVIENRTGKTYVATDPVIKFRNAVQSNELPINVSQLTMVTKPKAIEEGIVIIDFGQGLNSRTTKYLAQYLQASKVIEDPENYGYTKSSYQEDVLVLVTPSIQE